MPSIPKAIKSPKRRAAIKRKKPIRPKGKFKAHGSNALKTYLKARFQEKRVGRRNKKCKVTPLVSMNIATLERACSAMQKMAFSDIMEDRIREDRNLGRPFEAASTFVPRGTPRNFHAYIEIMKELGERMRIDFGMYE